MTRHDQDQDRETPPHDPETVALAVRMTRDHAYECYVGMGDPRYAYSCTGWVTVDGPRTLSHAMADTAETLAQWHADDPECHPDDECKPHEEAARILSEVLDWAEDTAHDPRDWADPTDEQTRQYVVNVAAVLTDAYPTLRTGEVTVSRGWSNGARTGFTLTV